MAVGEGAMVVIDDAIHVILKDALSAAKGFVLIATCVQPVFQRIVLKSHIQIAFPDQASQELIQMNPQTHSWDATEVMRLSVPLNANPRMRTAEEAVVRPQPLPGLHLGRSETSSEHKQLVSNGKHRPRNH